MRDAGEISYAHLSLGDWKDGHNWLHKVKYWSETYEKSPIVPASTNKQLVDARFEIFHMKMSPGFLGPCKETISLLFGKTGKGIAQNKRLNLFQHSHPSL